MSSSRFPASLPRKMYWSDEVGGYASCPDCGARLESERHAYILATRRKGNMECHTVGNSAGHFCGKCPGVVLHRAEFERFVALAGRTTNGIDYLVMGILDLDAVSEEKRSLPFDDDTNPIPIVEFTNTSGTRRSSARRQKKRKKRRRSGK